MLLGEWIRVKTLDALPCPAGKKKKDSILQAILEERDRMGGAILQNCRVLLQTSGGSSFFKDGREGFVGVGAGKRAGDMLRPSF